MKYLYLWLGEKVGERDKHANVNHQSPWNLTVLAQERSHTIPRINITHPRIDANVLHMFIYPRPRRTAKTRSRVYPTTLLPLRNSSPFKWYRVEETMPLAMDIRHAARSLHGWDSQTPRDARGSKEVSNNESN